MDLSAKTKQSDNFLNGTTTRCQALEVKENNLIPFDQYFHVELNV